MTAQTQKTELLVDEDTGKVLNRAAWHAQLDDARMALQNAVDAYCEAAQHWDDGARVRDVIDVVLHALMPEGK